MVAVRRTVGIHGPHARLKTTRARAALTAALAAHSAEYHIVQVAEELLVKLLALSVVLHVPERAAKDARVQSVRRPKAIVPGVRFHQEARDDDVVQEPRQLVLGETKEGDVLDQYVHGNLEGEVQQPVVHGVGCQQPATELRYLMVLVVVDGMGADLVHCVVQPAEEEVVDNDTHKDLAHQPRGCDATRWRGCWHLDEVEDPDTCQVTHELQVGADRVEDHAIMLPKH
mmetsp:Transcript_98883/g.262605  ORF Transcript_98883/g.262605 Transcript_98883/m.262605 type:complete len:228 (-) Transcript_98883:453-1136(-)